MICGCHMYSIKVGEHMNRQDETRIDEGLRDYHSLNIWIGNWILNSQIFSCIWVVMIRTYNFQSTAYECDMLVKSHNICFLPFVWKKVRCLKSKLKVKVNLMTTYFLKKMRKQDLSAIFKFRKILVEVLRQVSNLIS